MYSYEQLTGERGKKIFYRAERFPASSLFGSFSPHVEIGDEVFRLRDVSMTGLALLAPTNRLIANQVGETVDYRVRLGQSTLHEGKAMISRVHRGPENIVVGLGLVTDYLDVAGLLNKQQDLVIRQELQEVSRPADDVDPAYKLLVADVIDMLRRYQMFLARQRRVTNGVKPIDENDAAELLARCEEHIIPEWRTLWHRANEMLMPLMNDREALLPIKRYTERVLTPEFLVAPISRRAYEKPLGYPGDFGFMNYIYQWASEGDTLYERLVHRLGLEIGHCIVARMRAMEQAISDAVGRKPSGSEVHIANVGAGPAQEIQEYLRQHSPSRPIRFTLIDQQKEALDYAYDRIYPLCVAGPGDVRVSCLHISFMDMLKKRGAFAPLGQQDLIYSIGLVDYLPLSRARKLVATLYRHLVPGGTLVVGNMRNTVEGTFWPIEVICDWSLIYRDEADMLAMADGLGAVGVEVTTDSTGQVLLMYLRRPQTD